MDRQKLQNVIEEKVVQVAQIVEERLDDEIRKLDEINTEDDFEALRARRLRNLKAKHQMESQYKAMGHGEYDEIKTVQDVFETLKKSKRVVLHFYREATPRCPIFDQHLDILAKKHLETKFCKVLADNVMFLCEKLNVRVIPTLALFKDDKVVDYIIGFGELGNCDDFSTDILEWRLACADVIDYDKDIRYPPDVRKATVPMKKRGIRDSALQRGDEEDDDL